MARQGIGAYPIGSTPIGAAQSAAVIPTIDDINTDDTIDNAETGNTINYSNFDNQSGTFTLSIRSDSDATATNACTNLSLAAGTGTFDAPNVRDNGETPTKGAPFTTSGSVGNSLEGELVEADAAPDQTAVIPIIRNPEANYAVVEVESARFTVGSLLENVTPPVVDGSILYGSTTEGTSWLPDGTIFTDQVSGTRNFLLWKKDAGTWEQIIFNLGGSAGGPSTGGVGYFEDMIQSYITDYIEE